MPVHALSIALCLSLAIGALAWRTNNFSSFTYESDRQNSVDTTPVRLSDWPLQNSEGQTVLLSELSSEFLLVDFIYTRCPTICRALGSRYEQLQNTINASGNQHITLLSISIDPSYDTPKQLKLYQQRYKGQKESWHLARPANDEALRLMVAETGLRVIPDEFGGLAHSDAIHLIKNRVLSKIESWESVTWEKLIIAGKPP